MSDGQVAISLTGVSKSFGDTQALSDCSFSARFGEVHAIVGENGSGKSTLAKIMSGVQLADSGEVSVIGRKPRTPIEAQAVGVATIFQEILVADNASILDNLYVGQDPLLRPAASARAREAEARALMRRFTGLDLDPQMRVGDLSLSVKQWIVIGRAILRKPKVLILDESSAALDLDSTVRLHEEIERLRAAGAAVLIVTHRIAELVRIADRATVLRDGRTVGVLEKADINERNLLAMMTPQDRRVAMAQQRRAEEAAAQARPVMTAAGMQVATGSKPIDFSITPGMIVGITGLDGQGHERFVSIISGIRAAQGAPPMVHLDNGTTTPIQHLADADAAGILYVSGDRKREGIFPDLSIFENLAIGLYRRNLAAGGWIRRAKLGTAFATETRRFSIKIGRPSDKITSLSGGNQQKVLIGRAFASEPRVIVLNDPARGVDLGTKRDLYRELREFADRGGAVVYLSSEIEEFLGFADRVDIFLGGSIFRSLSGPAISEDRMLAAMFGQPDETPIEFDAQEPAA